MTDASLPEEVRSLLFDSVDTFEELEVLVFLHAEATHSWTASAVGEKLGLTFDAVTSALESLRARRLIERIDGGAGPRFRLDARSERAAAVQALATCWATHRYEIARLMGIYAMERVRNSAARAFADAFLLGRKRKDG